jgi:large subunit ribosomal protein L14e
MLDVGRICIKTAGREVGRYCVVVSKTDDNFVVVTGPRHVTDVKRRRCNILHLKPADEIIKIKPDASDDEIIKEYAKANLFSKLKIERPVSLKAEETAEAERHDSKTDLKQEEKQAVEKGEQRNPGLRNKLKLKKSEPEAKKPEKPKTGTKKAGKE